MENEIGHKMRCAVKAKLIELGTGGSTGYIDDELPDYVMIMVANKRSRQQMNEDLALFLGSNTQEFVNWLHQVLQKLQEVAVPAVAASLKPKRKLIETNDNKKEKKDKRKKIKHSHKDKDTEEQQQQQNASVGTSITQLAKNTDNTITTAVPSITDVFADHLIQKARTTLEIEKSIAIKTSIKEQNQQSQELDKELSEKSMPSDDFDIPTISEIAENAVVTVNRRKEISALADLQRKINQAKRQLKSLGSGESEDEDFINIKDDDGEFAVGEDDDSSMLTNKNNKSTKLTSENKLNQKSTRIPITYSEKDLKTIDDDLLTPPIGLSTRLPPPPQSQPPSSTSSSSLSTQKRTSVMDRLGVRGSASGSGNSREKITDHDSAVDNEPNRPIRENIISLSANRRMEKEIYIPFFRRKDDSSANNSSHRDRNPSSSSSNHHHHHDEQTNDRSHLKRPRERERDRPSEYEKRKNSSTIKDNNNSRNLNTRSNQHYRKISPLRDLRERVSESKRTRNATPSSSSSNHRTTSSKSVKSAEINNSNNNNTNNNNNMKSSTTTPPPPPPPPVVVSLSKKRLLESRVFVAPPKPEYDENIIEVPVNSIIKVQPRPIVPTNKQASKNLLLRAVAEAQKSTALIKPRKEINDINKKSKQSSRSAAALYSKSYRDKKNRLKTENIVIEIAGGGGGGGGGGGKVGGNNLGNDDDNGDDEIRVDDEGNFLVKKLNVTGHNDDDISDIDDENIYISLNTSPDNDDDDNIDDDDDDDGDNESRRSYDETDDRKNHTQFVVTLDDDKFSKKLSQRHFDLDEDDLNGLTDEPKITKQIKSITLKKDRINNASPLSLSLNTAELTTNQTKVNKLIIKNDTEDEEELRKEVERSTHHSSSNDRRGISESVGVIGTTTTNIAVSSNSVIAAAAVAATVAVSGTGNIERPKIIRRNVSPIKFDLSSGNKKDDNKISNTKSNSTKNLDRNDDQKNNTDMEINNHRHSNNEKRTTKKSSHNSNDRNDDQQTIGGGQHHKVTTKHTENYRKYDNLPPLSSTITSSVISQSDNKSKERCKYYPSCGKGDNCEFTHPPACKQFPNCKFGDQCLYSHPRCKFDLTCTKHGCNFSHSVAVNQGSIGLAPPLSSHVVPVTNYKSITNNQLPAMCKFYPNCTNTLCTFFHPKICRFGKNCVNKIECNFYHHFDVTTPPAKDKLKWVATSPVY